jgi:ubiquinone/menaquinone biosynthesis C-methylase UbiE
MSDAVERTAHTDVLARHVELRGKTVIDVGCGAGALVRWLRDRGAEVLGVECGDVMMRLALAADPDHPDSYRSGVAQALPLADASADAVVFSYSLHHVPPGEMVNALSEAHRVLRPGGVLYVVEPVAAGPGHEVIKLIDDETEVRAFALAALERAPSLGFVLDVDVSYTSRTVIESAEALAERVVGVDPTRAENMQRHRVEFIERFRELATPVADGYAFDQVNVVKVFRKS